MYVNNDYVIYSNRYHKPFLFINVNIFWTIFEMSHHRIIKGFGTKFKKSKSKCSQVLNNRSIKNKRLIFYCIFDENNANKTDFNLARLPNLRVTSTSHNITQTFVVLHLHSKLKIFKLVYDFQVIIHWFWTLLFISKI